MKHSAKIALATVALTILAACSNSKPSGDSAECPESPEMLSALADSADFSAQLGKLTARTYRGTLPDSSTCVFSVFSQEHSGDGTFTMHITAADKQITSLQGSRYTLRGKNDATVWSCTPSNDSITYYFLYPGDESSSIYLIPNDTTITKQYPLQLTSSHDIDLNQH